jgi:hypothetical protein
MHRFYRSAVFALLAAALPACNGAPTVGVPDPEFDLVSPANGAIAVSTAPTFFWTTSIGAMTYTLQVSTDIGFSTFVVDQPGIAGTSVTPGTTLSDGTVYYWRVIADHSSGNVTANAAPFAFTTGTGPPGPFTMTSPANSATAVATLPTYTWNPSVGATSYRLEVSTTFNFVTNVLDQTGIIGTSFTQTTPVLLHGVTYYWRVTATGPGGDTLASPSPSSFTTG